MKGELNPGLTCPDCKSSQLTVLDTRAGKEYIRRRRRCLSCGRNFTTYEIPKDWFKEMKDKC